MGRKLKSNGKKKKKTTFSSLNTSDFFNDLETPSKDVVPPEVKTAWLKKGDASSTNVNNVPKITPASKSNSFAGLFRENRTESKGMPIECFENGDGDVILDKDDSVPIHTKWGFCLVGCFSGRFPGGKAVHDIKDSWGVPCKVIPHTKYWTIFKFKTLEDRDKVFEGGPYSTWGKTLMLKQVDEGTLFDESLFLDIPIWVKFYDVPLSFWNPRGLGKIASKVGKPLYSDQVTNECTSAKYARILVVVDLRKELIFDYIVKTPWGSYTQKVCYEDCPEYCCHCKEFGHFGDKCAKVKDTRKQEVVKDVNASPSLELQNLDVDFPVFNTSVKEVGHCVSGAAAGVVPRCEAALQASAPSDEVVNAWVKPPVLPIDSDSGHTDSEMDETEGEEVSEDGDDSDSPELVERHARIRAIPDEVLEEIFFIIDKHEASMAGNEDEWSKFLWIDEITFELANAMKTLHGHCPWSRERYDEIYAEAKASGCHSITVIY